MHDLLSSEWLAGFLTGTLVVAVVLVVGVPWLATRDRRYRARLDDSWGVPLRRSFWRRGG